MLQFDKNVYLLAKMHCTKYNRSFFESMKKFAFCLLSFHFQWQRCSKFLHARRYNELFGLIHSVELKSLKLLMQSAAMGYLFVESQQAVP